MRTQSWTSRGLFAFRIRMIVGRMARLKAEELETRLLAALTAAGFSRANAQALAAQTVLAQSMEQTTVGLEHIFDYLDNLEAGRIDGRAEPKIRRMAPGVFAVDGCRGLPQLSFDLTFETFVAAVRELGLAVLLIRNVTLCGALGTFTLRIAEAGLVSLAATNGPVLLAGSGGKTPVYCTNPMAFAAPRAGGFPLLIDQSSSATAYVNIRKAAACGAPIPEGWALDAEGRPTTDAAAALDGTLLPFGGSRGGNIALMVEVLAAGLTGANWSLDAPSYFDGANSPATGLFVLAIDPSKSYSTFAERMAAQMDRLSIEHGVHVPGAAKGDARYNAVRDGIQVAEADLARLKAISTQTK